MLLLLVANDQTKGDRRRDSDTSALRGFGNPSSELITIEGGPKTVSNALVVHTEVEIVEQYVGQPLWADVDHALRRKGFVMHTVYSYGSRPMLPFAADDARLVF